MRVGMKVFAGIIAGLIVGGVGLTFVYLTFNARSIFNAQASALTSRHVEARAVGVEFPAGIVIDGLKVDGLLECKRVHAAVDVLSLLSSAIRISTVELDAPVITLDRTAALPAASAPPATPAKAVAATKPSASIAPKAVILTHFVIRNGVLKVLMSRKSGGRHEYRVEAINVQAHNVPLTEVPVRTDFSVTASLARVKLPFGGHSLKSEGWLNWADRDMNAAAQVADDDGVVGVKVTLVSQHNALKVDGTFNVGGNGNSAPQGKKAQRLENVVLGLLSSTGMNIKAGFAFTTKMDNVDLGALGLSGNITTSLNSEPTSGNIVAGSKAAL